MIDDFSYLYLYDVVKKNSFKRVNLQKTVDFDYFFGEKLRIKRLFGSIFVVKDEA